METFPQLMEFFVDRLTVVGEQELLAQKPVLHGIAAAEVLAASGFWSRRLQGILAVSTQPCFGVGFLGLAGLVTVDLILSVAGVAFVGDGVGVVSFGLGATVTIWGKIILIGIAAHLVLING